MNRPVAVALAVSAVLAVGVPATANAAANNVIKVDKSINRIQVGFSERKVLNKMETSPTSIQTGVNDFGRFRVLTFKKRFSVTILENRGVTLMVTKSAKQRTFDGIGVGSTRSQVRKAYTVTCEPVATEPGQELCLTKVPVVGETATTFRLQDKVVYQVDVGTLVD